MPFAPIAGDTTVRETTRDDRETGKIRFDSIDFLAADDERLTETENAFFAQRFETITRGYGGRGENRGHSVQRASETGAVKTASETRQRPAEPGGGGGGRGRRARSPSSMDRSGCPGDGWIARRRSRVRGG